MTPGGVVTTLAGLAGSYWQRRVDHPLLDSLKSIGETSFDHVKVSRPANDCTNVAGSGSATGAAGAARDAFDHVWKIIECSPGRGDIARSGEAS